MTIIEEQTSMHYHHCFSNTAHTSILYKSNLLTPLFQWAVTIETLRRTCTLQ